MIIKKDLEKLLIDFSKLIFIDGYKFTDVSTMKPVDFVC